MQEYVPDRINQEKNDAYAVWNAMTFCEWVPEATRCLDVLTKQVTADSQTCDDTNETVSYCGSNESRRNHQEED